MDRRVAFALALLALAPPLAGCMGGEETPPGSAPSVLAAEEPGAVPSGPPSADVPTWSRGDAWAIVPEGGEGSEATLVVISAGPDGYTLATTDQETAAYDALHDVSYLGRIRASDLAGAQGGQAVQYFSFPLTDGKTWQTTWDGLAVTLKATWVPAQPTSAGVHPAFLIEGTVDGQTYVKYDYVPELRWWSHLSFANGYGFKVDRTYVNWSGGYVQADVATLLESAEGLAGSSGAFTVGQEQAFVEVSLSGASTAALRAFALVDPAGMPYPTESDNVAVTRDGYAMQERIPPTPGDWRIVSPVLQADGDVHLLVRQVQVRIVPFP